MPISNMNAEPRRPNEEPYVEKLLVRFREGRGSKLPRLLDKVIDFCSKILYVQYK
jgi:hypothetical protein